MTARKAPSRRTYSIEQVSVMTGIAMRTWRRVAGTCGFPGYTVGMVTAGVSGPLFNADEVDAWIAERRAEVAEIPTRWEAGPYKNAKRAEVTARRMNLYSVGAVPVEVDGEHFVFVPVADGVAPADVADNLAELFPTVRWKLYDQGYRADAWLDAT